LARIREKRKDSGDSTSRGGLAGGDGNEELQQVIINLATSGLDDVDVFLTDRLLDLNPGLAHGELREQNLRGWDSQHTADRFGQLRVGSAPDDNKIANHSFGWS
jgi:hypothetical protein